MDTLLSAMKDSTVFSTIDQTNAYYQVPLRTVVTSRPLLLTTDWIGFSTCRI